MEVLFIGTEMTGPYSADQHWFARKFLFWEAATSPTSNDLLVVGDQNQHLELRSAAFRHYSMSKGVQQLAPMTGAGDLSDGRIMSWRSVHYDLTTPEIFWKPIIEALGAKW